MSSPAYLNCPHDTPRLWSYCLRWDDGAAPNPFWGVCTLVICKPGIREEARPQDWIVGIGSSHTEHGDWSGKLIYAMRVDEVMPMWDYDLWAQTDCPGKIPDMESDDQRRRRGDAIYDFTSGKPVQRSSVHGLGNLQTDLSGRHALLSRHFYYFGCQPITLRHGLKSLAHKAQGEKYRPNASLFSAFINWIDSLGYTPNVVHAHPALWKPDPEADYLLLRSCMQEYTSQAVSAAMRCVK